MDRCWDESQYSQLALVDKTVLCVAMRRLPKNLGAKAIDRVMKGLKSVAWRLIKVASQVNVPKTRRTYCKGKDCKKHTNHKVTQYKAGKVFHLST